MQPSQGSRVGGACSPPTLSDGAPLYCTDADGNPLTDEQVTEALKPQVLTFPFFRRTFRIEVDIRGVGLEEDGRVRSIGFGLILAAGYKHGEEITDVGPYGEPDPRYLQFLALSADSQEMFDV